MKSLLLGLDLGTSSVKAGVYDLDGRELAVSRSRLSVSSPADGWAEQDPLAWEQAAAAAARSALAAVGEGAVEAVGLCGQCPGHVLATENGEPVGPAIIWRDRRAVSEASWLAANVTPRQSLEWVGSPSLGDATMTPARLLWLARNRSADWARAAWVLQPKDFLGLYLTGKAGTDNHTSFLLANPSTRRIHPEYLELLSSREEHFPPVGLMTSLLGTLMPGPARAAGLPAGIPVFTGTIDAYCDILAGGGFMPGQGVDVSGTSETVALGVERYEPSAGVYPDQLEGAGTFLCGPSHSGCGLQDWLAQVFYQELGSLADPARLERDAAATPPGADGLLFLPYIFGERAPVWDSQAKGAFVGISSRHGRPHFARAVYESTAFVVRHILEMCAQAGHTEAASVVVCGGGARSRFWNQVKADILQKPVQPLEAEASACLGAAVLAAVGRGLYPSLADACAGMRRLAGSILPDDRLAGLYNEKYALFRQIYPVLHSLPGSE